ncbi:hypothetical protein TruAng_002544 [Truncatella angustata]|nr:hypothetical protein TruAng_002544 [Truncatella angustata]
MHRAPTRQRGGRGVSFAPLAQNDSDLLGPNDDVSQRWENLTATDDIRTRIHSIFRNTAPMVEDDEDDGLQHVRPRGHSAAYAPVGNLVSGTVAQEANIAELAGAPTEYYAPYPRAPSALSKLSDAPTETTDLGSTYSGFEPGDKYLHYAPRIASVQVREESPGSQPPELPDFKPFVLRRIFLSVLLLIVTVLFVLMIVAIRVLPDDTQSLATGLISRNSSKVKPRSLGVEPQVSWIPHHMNIRQNGNSTVMPSTVSSASDPIESPSSIPSTSSTSTSTTTTTTTSSTTSTLSTMTTSSTIAPSSTVLSSTSTRETSSTTTTTTPSDTQPQKPSKGSDVPPSTILSESTVVKPTSTADTKTTATTEKEQPTDTGPTATDHNSPPSDGGNNSGGEKTRSHAGEPQPTKSAPITTGSNPSSTSDPAPSENDSSLTTTVVTTAQQSQPSTSDAKPTGGESQTSPPDVSTVTTSTYQIPSSQDNQPPPVYTTSSNGEDGSPHLTTGLPLVTCTIDIIQTYVQWFTIPAVTVNLGLSVGRRYAAVDASRVRRQAAVCDTTVTITHDSTIMRTTALTTITIGLGNEQPGPTPTSTINYSSGSVQTEIYTVQTSVPLTVPTTSSAVDGTSSTYDQTVPDDTATGSPTTPDQGITSTTTVQIPDATSQPGVSTNTQGTGTQATSSQLITQPSDNQPTGTQFTVTQYTNTQPSRTEPSNAESSRHETTGTQATGTEPTDSQSSNNQPVGNQPTDTTPNSQPTNAIPSGTAPSSTATNGKSATVTGLTTIIYPTGSTVINSYALDTSQADIHSSFSTATELVITTDISSFTEINTALTAAANSTTLVDDPPRLGPNTNVATVGAVSASSRSGIGQQGPIETHEEPPVPFTTTAYVIESTNVVQTVVSKVTIPPSTAETDNALAVGAVFMTSVEVTSVFYDTRLATLQVLHGVMPNSDDGLQVLMATTLTDDYGHPTSTMTLTKYGYLTTQTLTDSLGFATSTKINSVLKYPSVTTITDSSGKVRVKTYYSKLTTATLRNSNGVATTTQVLEITETPTVVTEFDAAGHATKTITKMVPDGTSTSVSWVTATKASNASMQQVHYDALPISSSGYFTGILLPTLLAIGLAIPIRILDQTVKLYQPFSAMTWSYLGLDIRPHFATEWELASGGYRTPCRGKLSADSSQSGGFSGCRTKVGMHNLR